ncbi:hypothetical protein [Desulfosporosinus lacus]|uniref:Uncharacterized protein n=1 Tax=Desulfosporosinus lacus DSM 15449 TaxID=1121420 RepID=A0A1M5V289_9FIRM|nr:hypothetical protein [Desulfosporosinus lacus]SHH69341.1 hypothetical protein SAMN02746098_01168 [Desulfosporosinus lacus DSM 15449]
MNNQENGKQPVTWDMLAAKMDKEMQKLQFYSPPADDTHALLSSFKEAMTRIYRCLKERQIPADLYAEVYKQDYIVAEVIPFWLEEEELRGGNIENMADVAAHSVENWLHAVGLNKEDDRKIRLEGLRLDDRTLTYSEVELTADGQTTSFLTGGIPDTYSIDDSEQYQEFVEGLPPLTEITVAVSSWSVGHGESEAAAEDELAVIEENLDLLEQQYGLDPLQSECFTEIAPDNGLEFDEESDEELDL